MTVKKLNLDLCVDELNDIYVFHFSLFIAFSPDLVVLKGLFAHVNSTKCLV